MKILLATDGMRCSWPAEELVARIPWPADTAIEVMTVITEPELDGLSDEAREAMLTTARFGADAHLRSVARRISAAGRRADMMTSIGRPATVIIEEAERLGADLVVVGSRGRGTFATQLLGSVAAEVVDHAARPVLVARNAHMERVVLADDGSCDADHAASLVATWSIFQRSPVTVTSVAPLAGVMVAAGPVRHDDATEHLATAIAASRAVSERVAHDRTLQLARAGVHAREDPRVGDPAAQIVDAAREANADLIVMGSRGRTGLPRLLLGSVARNVLTHAPCSVLIASRPREVLP